MTKVPYVHSNYERKVNDNYQTIDKRCVYGLLSAFYIPPTFSISDVCSPQGSGILDAFSELKYTTITNEDAFADHVLCDWIVTNPPYTRGLVDNIIYRQIKHVENHEVKGLAVLLRSNFDFARSRLKMFAENKLYMGQIKLLFRPWWSEERKAQPIHNYTWHIWRHLDDDDDDEPFVRYATGNYPDLP